MTHIRKLEAAVVDALEDVKATEIRVYDVGHFSSLFDRVIIASAESNRQLRALANSVREKTKAAGGRIYGVEGEESGEWVLVDLGDIVVHIMQPAVRAHYNLEELWDQPKPRPARRTAARAKRPAGTRKPRKPA